MASPSSESGKQSDDMSNMASEATPKSSDSAPVSSSSTSKEAALKDADKGMKETVDNSKQSTKKTSNKPKSEKIKVHLVAVGSAPILKKSKFLMNADDRFSVANSFLRKILKLSYGALFLYVNAAFVPSPDQRMGDLFDCFGVRGELVIHYSLQEAWG